MASFFLKRNVPVLIHLLAWVLVGSSLFIVQPMSWGVNLPVQFWIKQGIFFCSLVGAYYFNSRVLMPKLLFRNHTRWYILSVISTVATILLIHWGLERGLHLHELMWRALHPDKPTAPPNRNRWFQPALLIILSVLGISTAVTAVQKSQQDAQLRQDLEQAKTVTELSFLKAQINPHFFFNTLNNIYALTLIDVDTAREALHKLSRMMRYVLYETQAATTVLSKEISFVEDYIQLMQLRLTDKVTIQLDVPKPIRDVPVAPMLLLPFVENAFKHGVSSVHPSRIYVGIQQYNGTLELEVRNTIFTDKTPSLEQSNGIGLANTRRRLDLLYPNQYNLSVVDGTPENEYLVHLTLHLV